MRGDYEASDSYILGEDGSLSLMPKPAGCVSQGVTKEEAVEYQGAIRGYTRLEEDHLPS